MNFNGLNIKARHLARGKGMEDKSLQGRRRPNNLSYIFICIGIHLFLSLCYCLVVDITEANAIVLLLRPGTISLFFLFITPRKQYVRILLVMVSILITFIFNQWHLATGNKIVILGVQVACFIACWSITAGNKSGWLMMNVAFFLLCIWNVARQEWIKQQFEAACVYIIDDGISCGANGHCFQYIAAKGRGVEQGRQTLFSSEDYVNINYSYPEGIPAVNFYGMGGEFSQYLLCDGRLRHVERKGKPVCN